MRILIAAIALASTGAAVTAAPILAQQMPGSKSTTAITGGSYTADPNHTLVSWEVNHLGITPLWGLFGQVSGTLQLDPKNPAAAKVDVTIPIAKLATAAPGLSAHLVRPGKDGAKPDFFGPAPADARFVSTGVDVTGTRAKLRGDLTLNGVTRPIALDVDFYGAGAVGGKEQVGFEARGTLNRSDFGLGLAVPMVSDQVTLKIAAAFVK